jgi:hypothetical protein
MAQSVPDVDREVAPSEVRNMQSSSWVLSTGAAVLCAVLPSAASAHHSFAAVFEMDKVTEIEGRVTGSLVNPHITIDVAASDGQSWSSKPAPSTC